MFAFFRSVLHPRSLRFGLRTDRRSRFRDPRFASFISHSNRRSLNTDIADALLQGRKYFRHGLVLAAVAGGAWVLIESAKALSMF
jgi:hypothetical protein